MMNSRWALAALIVSLLINLLLAGFLLGQRSHQAAFNDPTRMFPRWVRTLEEPRRAQLRPQIREYMQKLRPSLRLMRQQHRTLQNAIGAQPFDAAHLRATLDEIGLAHNQIQQVSNAGFVEFVTALTDDERTLLVKQLRTPRHPRRPGGPPPAAREVH